MLSTVTRSRRGARGPVIAVTGADEGIGPTITRRLAEDGRFGTVLAIGSSAVAESMLPGVRWTLLDVGAPHRSGTLANALSGVDVIAHLALNGTATDRRDRNVRGTQALLEAASAARVPRLWW